MTEGWQPEERLFLHHALERDNTGSGRRYFSRGGVKFALLELLEKESMHGYQMMKALEDQSGGTYKPSAGSIYPTLQMLRDQGFVESSKQDGKKVFEITDEGRAYLLEEKENGIDPSERREFGSPDEEGAPCDRNKPNRRLTPAGKELLHLLKAAERTAVGDAGKAVQLRIVLDQLRLALRQIASEEESNRGGNAYEQQS
ncbi:PadR family transcriptional regulator [Paenibacillus sp. LPE1-1-1.1]|uniref:PadR family transcriptional regulator n=1 Tax=Paenibacillus sp. LPE1-1-1.1 TaxID=3135230 RepID=UPI00342A3C79